MSRKSRTGYMTICDECGEEILSKQAMISLSEGSVTLTNFETGDELELLDERDYHFSCFEKLLVKAGFLESRGMNDDE